MEQPDAAKETKVLEEARRLGLRDKNKRMEKAVEERMQRRRELLENRIKTREERRRTKFLSVF